MDTAPVSQKSLLRSLDSLEQVCRKRMKEIRLIDDEQLPRFVRSNKEALVTYAAHNNVPELSEIAASISIPRNKSDFPAFLLEVFTMLGCVVIATFFPYLMFLLYILVPVALLVAIIFFVSRSSSRNKRDMELTQIAEAAGRAKMILLAEN